MIRRNLPLWEMAVVALILLLSASASSSRTTPDKMDLLKKIQAGEMISSGPTDDPPPGPVVAVAEWEPATGVLITYPLWLPIELVAEMAEDVEVVTILADEAMMEQAIQEYVSGGVDTSNCSFLFLGETSEPWTRDCGPWYIFDGNDQQGLIDNLYVTTPSEWVPRALGDSLGIPVYGTGMATEGGNYMTDGMGTVMCESWLLIENRDKSITELQEIFADYLGVNNLVLINLTGFHIDTWAKFLDPGRILVIQPDPPDPNIEANVEYLRTLMSAYGRPYEIIRVQGRGYSNSLILNDKVLIPLPGDPTDSLALVTYQEAMPGYEVHGYELFAGQHGFQYYDAVHCRTHEMADPGMLRIVHVPLHDRENDGGDYYLEATIHAYSNEPLIGPPVIFWKTEGGTYSPLAMTYAGDDLYYGEIPQQPDGTDIDYYIEAEDASGRIEYHPYIGEGNPHHFHVGPDTEPPVVEFDPPNSLSPSEWPVNLTAYALDNRWISSVTLEYSINGIAQDDVEMTLRPKYAVYYTGMTAGSVEPGDVVEMRVKAVDTSINQNTTYSPYFTINIEGGTVPASHPLFTGVSPNPFNPATVIRFDLPQAAQVTLEVFDVNGRNVGAQHAMPLQDTRYLAGSHEITFDGSGLPSGVYLYRLTAGKYAASGKMVLLK